MFTVKGVKKGPSAMTGKESECFEVECQKGTFSGLLTPKEFFKQVKLRSQNGKPVESDQVQN